MIKVAICHHSFLFLAEIWYNANMDKNNNTYKSHIVLVRQLVRPYQIKTTDGKQVKYLDLKTETIKQIKVKEIDAEEKYFDEIMEEFLNKNIETPFADTVLKLRKMLNEKETKGLITKDLNIIRRFFQFSFLRNKELFKKVLKESEFASLISGFSHSVMLAFSRATDEYFKNKKISIMHNITNSGYGFVCPHDVVYYFFNSFHKSYNLAITIDRNIIACLNLTKESDDVDILKIENDFDIRAINCAAFLTERSHGVKYVVGKEDDLQRLIEDVKELESQKKDLIIIETKK